jgi:hypothetical protein
MVEPGDGLDFAAEPVAHPPEVEQLGTDQLERNLPAERTLPREIDDPHPAFADAALQREIAEFGRNGRRRPAGTEHPERLQPLDATPKLIGQVGMLAAHGVERDVALHFEALDAGRHQLAQAFGGAAGRGGTRRAAISVGQEDLRQPSGV